MTATSSDLLTLTANTIRGLSMDAVQKANSGHPGMPMGMADAAALLWLEVLRYCPDQPQWPGRDRFVLSAGHGSMLLYSLLHLAGFELPMSELQNFRQLHSRTPGHPEFGETAGVETTTGPLGQGFGNGVGMALAAKMEAARFGCVDLENRVFGIVSDGDLMEGISSEAGSLAGHLGLDNLVYLYDDNHITIDGETELSFTEDVQLRFEALGWRVLRADGHDVDALRTAINQAVAESERPTLIICRTHIAYGSPNKVDTAGSHGSPLGADEIAATKAALGMPAEDFWVPKEVHEAFRTRARENDEARKQWETRVDAWRKSDQERASHHAAFAARRVPDDILARLLETAGNDAAATRAISGKVIQTAAELVPSMVGGSADLDSSCKTSIKAAPAAARGNFDARNLHFGIREHGMAAIANGMALHGGYLPLCSTFLTFSDYMRPSIRLAALMKLPVTFVFTHDSLMLGEDGPTHQPVEHVAALRLIPNLHVVRPADGAEVAAAWTYALRRRNGPVAMALTRQSVPEIPRPADHTNQDLLRGAHLVRAAAGAQATVVATGAEVAPTIAAAESLTARGLKLRVVSVMCLELFLEQDHRYRDEVLPPDLPVAAVEMGRPEIWCQLTGSIERVVGVSSFGASAPAGELAAHFGFTAPQIAEQLWQMFGAKPAER
ncbi:MAG: transketolase [Planctomycetota bacterium]